MRILWVSDAPYLNTAYAKVTLYVAKMLIEDGHEVVALPFAGPVQGGLGREVLGAEVLPGIRNPQDIPYWFAKRRCDLAVILKDPYAVPGIGPSPMFWVAYFPVSEEPLPEDFYSQLYSASAVMTPSKFGVRMIAKHSRFCRDRVYYAPHGVDPHIYRPLDEPKERLHARLGFRRSDVVVGIVAMNRERKVIPNQLEAVKLFAERNRDLRVGLYIHSAVGPDNLAFGGWQLDKVVKTMGLRDLLSEIRFPDQRHYILGFTEAEMNVLYNALDVLLEMSTEGFGLPTLEAQAAGTPVVTVDHGAGPEINFLGLNAKVGGKIYTLRGSWWAAPDPESGAEMIERAVELSQDGRVRRLLHEKSLAYSWDRVYREFLRPVLDRVSSEILPHRVGGGT